MWGGHPSAPNIIELSLLVVVVVVILVMVGG